MRLFVIAALLAFVPCALRAQAPAPAKPAAPAGQAPKAAEPAKPSPLEPQGYTYDPQGRRDPFISLIRRGSEPSVNVPGGARPSGLPGLMSSEIAFKGTYRGRDGNWVAMVQGVDNKTYLARAGDKLLDGTVRSVTADELVILQRVNDPLSLETQREVRKGLHQKTEEAK